MLCILYCVGCVCCLCYACRVCVCMWLRVLSGVCKGVFQVWCGHEILSMYVCVFKLVSVRLRGMATIDTHGNTTFAKFPPQYPGCRQQSFRPCRFYVVGSMEAHIWILAVDRYRYL